jgi:predicted GIY-YIG superfamily endonuclease
LTGLLDAYPVSRAQRTTQWCAADPGTRQYGVDQLMYAEEYGSILEARARERALKRWRRAWKVALIEKANPEWRDLFGEYVR